MGNYNLTDLKGDYKAKWDKMVISPERDAQVTEAAKKVIAGKPIYYKLQTETGVPWYFIGVLHYRESDCKFNTHLHNGDSLNAKTVHVPQGRPRVGNPPFTFDYSAQDALHYEGFTNQPDWSLEAMAYRFEAYNGWGYRSHHCASPYLWSGSNDYTSGKFISDHVFDGTVVDSQMGTMPILKKIGELENINFNQAPLYVPLPQPIAPPTPTPVFTPAVPPPISPRAEVPRPTNDQMNEVSRKHWLLHFGQILSGAGTGTLGAVKALDMGQVEQAKSQLDMLKSFAADYGIWVVMAVLVTLVVYFGVLKKYIKDDVESGRYTPSGGEVKK